MTRSRSAPPCSRSRSRLPPTVRFADRAICGTTRRSAGAACPSSARSASTGRATRDARASCPPIRVLRSTTRHEARNVNALDEVPDSAWFEIRGAPRRRPARPRRWRSRRSSTARAAGEDAAGAAVHHPRRQDRAARRRGFVVDDARGASTCSSSIRESHAGLVTLDRGGGHAPGVGERLAGARASRAFSSSAAGRSSRRRRAPTKDDREKILFYDAPRCDAAADAAAAPATGRDPRAGQPLDARPHLGGFPYFGRDQGRSQRSRPARRPPRSARLRRLGRVGQRRRHACRTTRSTPTSARPGGATWSTTSRTWAARSAASPADAERVLDGTRDLSSGDGPARDRCSRSALRRGRGTSALERVRGARVGSLYPELGSSRSSTSSRATGSRSSRTPPSCARPRAIATGAPSGWSRFGPRSSTPRSPPATIGPVGGRAAVPGAVERRAARSRRRIQRDARRSIISSSRRSALLRRPVARLRARQAASYHSSEGEVRGRCVALRRAMAIASSRCACNEQASAHLLCQFACT